MKQIMKFFFRPTYTPPIIIGLSMLTFLLLAIVHDLKFG